MTKEELNELVALGQLIEGDNTALIEEILLAFEAAEEEPDTIYDDDGFTKNDLVNYMNGIVQRIKNTYKLVDHLNRREIKTKWLVDFFEKEVKDKKYVFIYKRNVGREKKTNSIMVPFLNSIKNSIEPVMYFEDLITKMTTAAANFDTLAEIAGISRLAWRKIYKKDTSLSQPNWEAIYKNIVETYEKEYVLTEKAYQSCIAEWVEGTKEAVKKQSYKNYQVDIKELYNHINEYFDNLPKLFNVYPDLKTEVITFFKAEKIISEGALIEKDGKKCITLVSLQNYIQSNLSISVPSLKEKDRTTITSNQKINNDLGAKNGYVWLADLLRQSIEENSSEYMQDELKKILENDVDPTNIKERVQTAITIWYQDVYTALSNLGTENIPRVNEIRTDTTALFSSYAKISGSLCSNLLLKIDTLFQSKKWETTKELRIELQDTVFKSKQEYDLKELLELWWKHFDGNFSNISEQALASKCLPLPTVIKEILERNTSPIAKSSVIDGITQWKKTLRNPFQNAAAGLTSFKDIKKTTFNTADFKTVYLEVLFDKEGPLKYFKSTIANKITAEKPATVVELDAFWNAGLDAIDPTIFWEAHLLEDYVTGDYDDQLLYPWRGEIPLVLPHANRFVGLLTKMLLKLPIRKRPKQVVRPASVENRALDGYIELFDKWGETYLTQGEQIGQLLGRCYHIFDTVIGTNTDVQNDFDRFIDQCNSELEALYDNSWLSGTLGTLATAAIVILAAPEIAALSAGAAAASLVTATGAKIAGETVTKVVELVSPTPTKYSSSSNGVFKSLTSMNQNLDEMGAGIMKEVITAIGDIRKVYRKLVQYKIQNLTLSNKDKALLDKVDKQAGVVYNLFARYISQFGNQLNAVDLTNIYTIFEGYILKEFIQKKVKDPGEDILESSLFKAKLISHKFCTEKDFVDHILWYDSWIEDYKRLKKAISKYNPNLFGL